MKAGNIVKCRSTQRIGLIVSTVTYFDFWVYQILFAEGISEENGGYLEVISEQ
jgi:hypothetical protein